MGVQSNKVSEMFTIYIYVYSNSFNSHDSSTDVWVYFTSGIPWYFIMAVYC